MKLNDSSGFSTGEVTTLSAFAVYTVSLLDIIIIII